MHVAVRKAEGISIFCLKLLAETLITTNMVVGQIDLTEREKERESYAVPSACWL